MTILITGGAGYIGSHAAIGLLDEKHEVVILDNLQTGYAELVPEKAIFIRGNSGDRNLVQRLIKEYKIDTIMHFAASLLVEESVDKPLEYYRNNVMNTLNLIETAGENDIKNFIFSSTAAVYASTKSGVCKEDSPLEQVSPYGSSKAMSERILCDYVHTNSNMRYAILRYFNVAGADPLLRSGQASQQATHLIKIALQTALGRREALHIYGTDYDTPDGTCIRDYIHVVDLVDAHIKALSYIRNKKKNIICNCGYGRGSSVIEVVEAVKKVVGHTFPVVEGKRRKGDMCTTIANADVAKKILGWQPHYDNLEKIIADAYAWEQKLFTKKC